jgi:hypothetical protein
VQGFLEPFRRVLRESGLMDDTDTWMGGGATLVVVGDLVDRGPDGIGVIDLLMKLQQQGSVKVLIGNHDILLLAAKRFPQLRDAFFDGGGLLSDLEGLTCEHVEWLRNLPAMLRHQDTLLMHADAMFYLHYGTTIDEVNTSFRATLESDDIDGWNRLLGEFSEHRAFLEIADLDHFLTVYGGSMLIHGHTPIARMLQIPPETVTHAHVYQDGRCVNVDPGLYLGGPGFAYLQRTDDTDR